ncbi:MAG: arginine--tRNA ligase [Legionellaceae bacterium]
MKEQIEQLIKTALTTLAHEDGLSIPLEPVIILERPRDPTHGDFSTNLAMILAKSLKMAPRALALRLLECIPSHEAIERIEIAGPGFINFKMSALCWRQAFEAVWASPTDGVTSVPAEETVVIDYSSPNLAKEMHVGHLRSTIIGDAIARMLVLKGYRVIRQNHVGDWGTQFGMLLAHFEDLRQSDDLALQDLESFYKAAKLRFDNEPLFADKARALVVQLQSGHEPCLVLWRKFIQLSLMHCQSVYQRLGVTLLPEDVRAESAYNDMLPWVVSDLRAQGLLVEAQGAHCVFLDQFKGKDNEPLPIIVQKKDGGFLYASTDLAAIHYRQSVLHAQRIIYVVDARQALHFQQMFALAYRAGYAQASTKLEHVSFGMVLDKSGKPYKSRDGGVTKLADLLDEAERRARELIASKQPDLSAEALEAMANVVGIASVKYADLSKNRIGDYVFDWDTMLSFEGNTAPYLLYAYTRVCSLFQKANLTFDALEGPLELETPDDEALVKQLLMFSEVMDVAVQKATPHLICTYLYELASLFSSFYEACPILNAEHPTLRMSRLKLAAMTARILDRGLSVLGITTLKRM